MTSGSATFPRSARPLLLMFFLSGFSALLYQVVWLRLAFATFGVITPVLSVVVSVFMLGLGIGSLIGGAWAGSVSIGQRHRALAAYALAEAMTGLGGLLVPSLFALGGRWLGGVGALASGPYLGASAAAIALSLLPWTVAMGTTFPLAVGFLRGKTGGQGNFGALYLWNVLGALVGVLGASYLLIEVMGFAQSLHIGAAVNLTISLAALLWWQRERSSHHAPELAASSEPPSPEPKTSGRVGRAGLVLFLTGFVSTAEEAAWFRSYTILLGTEVYAFASLLAVYLAATAAGSGVYRTLRKAGRDGSPWRLLPYLVPAGLLPLLAADPRWHPGAANVLLSLVPFCFLLGYQTPSILDRFGRDDPGAVGRLYALNVCGCILGPLVASYLLLPLCGERWTLALLPALLAVAALAVGQESPSRRRPTALAWAGLPMCLAAGLLLHTYVEGFGGDRRLRYEIRRDVTGTAAAVEGNHFKTLLVNGVGMTGLVSTTKVMAHLPLALLERPPQRTLAICFGMGTTFRSLTTWGAPADVVELVPSVPALFGFFHADAQEVLGRPGARVVIDDGRRFLTRSRDLYDLITIDPPPPIEAAGSSLLYSREFYLAAQARLSQDGILAQWMPAGEAVIHRAAYRTLRDVFPEVLVFRNPMGMHLLASRHPIQVPPAAQALRRMPPAAQRDLVEWLPGQEPIAVVAALLEMRIPVGLPVSSLEGPRITDDQPFNEYTFVRRHLVGLLGPGKP